MADTAIYEDVALGRVLHGPSEIAAFVEEATRASSDFRPWAVHVERPARRSALGRRRGSLASRNVHGITLSNAPSRDKYLCGDKVFLDVDKPLILLDWEHIYGAMLGNLDWSVPLNLPGRPHRRTAKFAASFLGGGKMHRERSGVPKNPQNQTMSCERPPPI